MNNPRQLLAIDPNLWWMVKRLEDKNKRKQRYNRHGNIQLKSGYYEARITSINEKDSLFRFKHKIKVIILNGRIISFDLFFASEIYDKFKDININLFYPKLCFDIVDYDIKFQINEVQAKLYYNHHSLYLAILSYK